MAAIIGTEDADGAWRALERAADLGFITLILGQERRIQLESAGYERLAELGEPSGNAPAAPPPEQVVPIGQAVERDEAMPITPVAGSASVVAPGVGVSGTGQVIPAPDQLSADPEHRIGLSDSGAVPVAQVLERHSESKLRLRELMEVVNGLHGNDAVDVPSTANTQAAPFSNDDLQLLRSVVRSAIELHKPAIIPVQVREALRAFGELFEELTEQLKKATGTVEATEQLIGKLGLAALALKGLYHILI